MLLAGDIGGTKTALAVFSPEHGARAPIAQRVFPSGKYPSLEAIAKEYLAEVDLKVTEACFAVAGPVSAGQATLTNLPWVIDESELQASLRLEGVRLLNDVEAMANAVPHLQPNEIHTWKEGEAVSGGAIALIAPGTGLGEAFLTWDGQRYRAYPSEGCHTNFGPMTLRETELLKFLQGRWGRVSYERVCAGRSIPDLYEFLKIEGMTRESLEVRDALAVVEDRTPIIMERAMARPEPDPLCLAALNLFYSIMGSEAGNLVLTVLGTGGLYIGGGIPQRIGAHASGQQALFLSSFQEKGRLTPLLARVPIHLILEPVALLGAAYRGFEIAESTRRLAA